MNPSDIVTGRQYLVRYGAKVLPVEVVEVSENLIKFRGRCPISYRCVDLSSADSRTILIQCFKQFVRFAVAKDVGANPCEMLTLVNDGGWWDKRKCVLPHGHRGECLTSLYLLEGVRSDREAEDFIDSLTDDELSEYTPVIIPRASWPTFEL